MLRHIVLLTFKAGASETQLDDWSAAVRTMCEASPEIITFSLGLNVGSGPNHFDSALVADFEDMEAFRRYISSPAHKAYVQNHALHVVDRIAAIQHQI